MHTPGHAKLQVDSSIFHAFLVFGPVRGEWAHNGGLCGGVREQSSWGAVRCAASSPPTGWTTRRTHSKVPA
jgi:hypothetical protein